MTWKRPTRMPSFRYLLAAAACGGLGSMACPAASLPESIAAASSSPVFFASGPQAALEEAVRAEDLAAIARALADGAAVDATGQRGVTPLMIAVGAQKLQSVRALLRAGADPDVRAADGNSAVSLATESYAATPDGHAIMLAVMQGGGNPDTLRPDRDPVIRRFINDHDLDDVRLSSDSGRTSTSAVAATSRSSPAWRWRRIGTGSGA